MAHPCKAQDGSAPQSTGTPGTLWLITRWQGLAALGQGCPVPPTAHPQVVAVLPPAGRELPLRWVPVEDAPTVPGVTWKTLTVHPLCSGQSPAAHGERPGAPTAPGCWGPLGAGGGQGAGCLG